MKNLKLFVFSLCLMLVAVLSVNAAECNLPGEDWPEAHGNVCEASLGSRGYLDKNDAWDDFVADGGDLVFYENTQFASRNFVKSGSIKAAKDENGDPYTLTFAGTFTVSKGVTLTIEDTKFTSANTTFDVKTGGTLLLKNVIANVGKLLINEGTTTITGGEITSLVEGNCVMENAGTLNVTGTTITANKVQATRELIKNAGKATLTNVDVKTTGNLVNVTAHNSTTTLSGENIVDANKVVVEQLGGTPASRVAAAVVNVDNGTYNTNEDAFVVDHGMVLNLNNGTVKSKGQVVNMTNAVVTVKDGSYTASKSGIVAYGSDKTASLTISGGTVVSDGANYYALYFINLKGTYAVSGGTFETTAKSNDGKERPAIYIRDLDVTYKDDKTTIPEEFTGILTGGKYLNNIFASVVTDDHGATVKVINQLVAEGYEVKEVTEGKKTYKVIVKTGAAEEAEPEKQPDASKPGSTGSEELPPDTYDAGLAYMGLAFAAVGASVVSIKKLRNN